MAKSKVYFTKKLSPETVVEMYKRLGVTLPGKVAVKVHSGEEGNQNYLHPEFMKPMVEYVHGTVVETNTAYGGARSTSAGHLKLLKSHGWSETFDVDLMDETGPDAVLEIPDGKVLKKDVVGKDLLNYDSMLVLAHFKGHPMGGYGGALKQLSIGCASSTGKALIHSGGKDLSPATCWKNHASKEGFTEAMADAAMAVYRHFEGKIAFVSMMCNLSVDCDCCEVAEDPCMADIGTLSSLDPVALDKACLDLIYAATSDPGQKHFLERVESRHGPHILEAADALGFGTTEYELINVD